MKKTLPHITAKQQEILKLLYTYRFLDRTQIQTLLKHKDKRRIISWLKDLREKEYIDWHYNAADFIAKSQPAIYYLSLNGIRYLRDLGKYPDQELRKRYKEPYRTRAFIDKCLLIADCCIVLQKKSDDKIKYTCVVSADYMGMDNAYRFLNELKPYLYFSKKEADTVTNYLLENFEHTLPRYQLRKRLKEYIDYLAYDWEDTKEPRPITLFICMTTADLLYVKRRVKKCIEETGEELQIRVTTLDRVKASGVASMIWEEM